jgi:hypothetical protein
VTTFEPIESCERVVVAMPDPPRIEHREARAYYRPSTDTVNLPAPTLFESAESYYQTLFHELSHSSGHERRLARKGITDEVLFGSHEYYPGPPVILRKSIGHDGLRRRTGRRRRDNVRSKMGPVRSRGHDPVSPSCATACAARG